MTSLFVGIICLVLGLIGIIVWSQDFMSVLKGAIPPILILVGALALFLGFDTLKEKGKQEEAAEETPPAETSEEEKTE